MHAVCRYPVKSTFIKATKSGNYIGRPIITEPNVEKYHPETTETPKGHMNQTRKNIRSNKPKHTPLEVPNTSKLRGRKVQDLYTNIYKVRNTVFSDQTGQFPTHSKRGKKYIILMVDIDSNAILVKPINIFKDAEITRAYRKMMFKIVTSRNNSQEAHLGQ